MPEDVQGEGTEDELFIPPTDPQEVEAAAEQIMAEVAAANPDNNEIEVVDAPEEFDEKFRRDFEGLLYIGKLKRTFRWMGHKFTIRTPYISELLEIGQLHKPYSETVADIKAYQALMVAAVLETVDGKPLPLPLTSDGTELEARFHYIMTHWYPWTLDTIYTQYLVLDAKSQEVINAMGKVPGSLP